MTQNQQILNWLQKPRRTLTRLTCFRKFGFMTINSRVTELRRAGHPIKSEMVTDKNGRRYAKYFLP